MSDFITIEPHYLGSLEYFTLLIHKDRIILEVCDTFKKQTFRNRAYFLGSNKILQLNVPLKFSNGTKTKDVKVDYSHRWIKDHWGTFYSAYGKSPFFEYFKDDFYTLWESKPTYLLDMNVNFLSLILKIIGKNIEIDFTASYQKEVDQDYRNIIKPKSIYTSRDIYKPNEYTQLFGDLFSPNLSIVDLIMNKGAYSSESLIASSK